MKYRITAVEIAAQLPRIRVEAEAGQHSVTGTTWVDDDVHTTWDARREALSREESEAVAIEQERMSTAAGLAVPAGWDAIGRDAEGWYAEYLPDEE